MKKLNNKGFSLVELIIVIAIMAILVGVVGTQVIPYLENSRRAKDEQIISSWNTAAMSAYSNAAAKINAKATYVISIGSDGKVGVTTSGTVTDADGAKVIKSFFEELTGISDSKPFDFDTMASKAGKNIQSVTITIADTGKIVTKTVTTEGHFDDIEN